MVHDTILRLRRADNGFVATSICQRTGKDISLKVYTSKQDLLLNVEKWCDQMDFERVKEVRNGKDNQSVSA